MRFHNVSLLTHMFVDSPLHDTLTKNIGWHLSFSFFLNFVFKKEVKLEDLLKAIKEKKEKILSTQEDIKILTNGVSLPIRESSRQRLGKRLLKSILIGKPFRVCMTGSSNTAGKSSYIF
jgi:hypothetical protein